MEHLVLSSPDALFAGLAERVGPRNVCGGADALVWVLPPLLLYLSAVCCHGGIATSPMPLPGVVSPLCATRWENKRGTYAQYARCAGCVHSYVRTVYSVHGTRYTHTHRGPCAHGAGTPGKPRPFRTGLIYAAIPGSGANQREPCSSHTAGWGPPGTHSRLWSNHVPSAHPTLTHTPQAPPEAFRHCRAAHGGARGCGWPRGDDARAGGRAGGRE